jgi:hypothetical protein
VVGNIDDITATHTLAWACDTNHTDTSVLVRLVVDSTYHSAPYTAHIRRESAVGNLCGGNENRGALIPYTNDFKRVLDDRNQHTVRIEALTEEGEFVPVGSSRTLRMHTPVRQVYVDPLVGPITEHHENSIGALTSDPLEIAADNGTLSTVERAVF